MFQNPQSTEQNNWQESLNSQNNLSDLEKKLEKKIFRSKDGGQVQLDKIDIENLLNSFSGELLHVNNKKLSEKVFNGLYSGATLEELKDLSIQTASLMISEEPEYSKLAARILAEKIDELVEEQGISSFSDSIARGFALGLIHENTAKFVLENADQLNAAIRYHRTDLFEFSGLITLYDRYLLRNPSSRTPIETPQYFFLRVACGLATQISEAKELYDLISSLDYMPSTPTLFNSGTRHPQMSSCYLLDSPEDSIEGIYKRYADIAKLSKFAGGIGVSYHRVRSRGSLIKGTNGLSNGIVPWLKTLDSSVAAVNQGGKRKGACCVYLETWHADIESFLELRNNTGDEAQRTHHLNLANWVPDLFMKRVENDGVWSLFDPKEVPHFPDLHGEDFEVEYEKAERERRYVRQISARELYSRMMKTLAETGNGWITFKDASNLKSNQTGLPENNIHLSNLCTEILEVTSESETAVCNLGSINLSRHVINGRFDFEKLAKSVEVAVRYLDRVVDINFYPIGEAANSNSRWRPVGLGVMGLQDAFFKLKLSFDSESARELSRKIQEEVYYHAVKTSCELAKESGAHPSFSETRAARGLLQFDLWGTQPEDQNRWNELKEEIRKFGLRNSLIVALAPTATIASIVGSYESIEPQVSNFFKRETLSGEFIQMNRYLVEDLRERNLWNDEIRSKIKHADGSIESIDEIPEELKSIYRTAWEIPMRSLIDMAADRGAYIDQSQSLNLFIESPTIGKLSSMYFHAWKSGLKTTYYLRSRPATKINKTSSSKKYSNKEAVTCSLENPSACEACQ